MSVAGANALLAQLDDYAKAHPQEADTVRAFSGFAACGADVCERGRRDGHFTASCWLVSADGERVLLTHHRKLNRWLQLGGHADGDFDLAQVALREAQEESGLVGLSVETRIYDIDAHRIPARGSEPEHTHWDVRFVIRHQGDERFVVSDESHALAWVAITQLLDPNYPDASLRRMAQKWTVART